MADPGLCALRAVGNLAEHVELSGLSSWVAGWHIEGDVRREPRAAEPRAFEPVVNEQGDSIPGIIELIRSEKYDDGTAYERIREGVRSLTENTIRELNCHLGPDEYVGLICVLKNGDKAHWNQLSHGLRDAVRYETLLQTKGPETLLVADCPDGSMDEKMGRRLMERTAAASETEPQVLLFTRNSNAKARVPWRITRTLEPKPRGKAGEGSSQCR